MPRWVSGEGLSWDTGMIRWGNSTGELEGFPEEVALTTFPEEVAGRCWGWCAWREAQWGRWRPLERGRGSQSHGHVL